jgi:hypothetical protein
MATVVARPGVVDAAPDVEPGFLGDQEDSSAAWTLRPAEIFGRENPWCRSRLAGGLDDHRRCSSTFFPHRTRLDLTLRLRLGLDLAPCCAGCMARPRRLREALVAVDYSRMRSWARREGVNHPLWLPAARLIATGFRAAHNWSGRTSGSLPACPNCKARAPKSIRSRTKTPRRRARSRSCAGFCFAGLVLPWAAANTADHRHANPGVAAAQLQVSYLFRQKS